MKQGRNTTPTQRCPRGTPFWLTETADVACGGNPWGATFLDTFRYLDQLGRLAKENVKVVMHNTLAASDYSLLDEGAGFTPKPNYWGALLWRRLMGTDGSRIRRTHSGRSTCIRALLSGHARRGGLARDQYRQPLASER